MNELNQIAPLTIDQFRTIEKQRACERLLQLCIEIVIELCNLFVSGKRLGLPAKDDDVFQKLVGTRMVSKAIGETLRQMNGVRNILCSGVYGRG